MKTKITLEQKHNWLKAKFKEHYKSGRAINKKKFIADFCLMVSTSKREVMKNLKIFEDAGIIKVGEERIEVIRI